MAGGKHRKRGQGGSHEPSEGLLGGKNIQYTTTLKDGVTPALSKMEKAFGALEEALLDIDLDAEDFHKAFEAHLKSDTRGIDKMADAVEHLGDEVEDAGKHAKKAHKDGGISLHNILELHRVMETSLGEGAKEKIFEFAAAMDEVTWQTGDTKANIRKLSAEIIQSAEGMAGWSVSANDVGEAIKGITKAGISNQDLIKRWAPQVSLVAVSMGSSAEQMAENFKGLSDEVGLSDAGIMEFFKNTKIASQHVSGDFDKMKSVITGNLADITEATRDMGQENKQVFLTNMVKIFGVLDEFKAGGKEFTDMMTKAMSGDISEAGASLLRQTGIKAEDWKKALQDPAQAQEYFKDTLEKLSRMVKGRGTASVKAYEQALGLTSGSLVKMVDHSDEMVKQFGEMTEAQKKTTDATKFFNESVSESSGYATMFKNKISYLLAKPLPLLGQSLMNIGSIIKDLPVMELILAHKTLEEMGIDLMSWPKKLKAVPGILKGVTQSTDGLPSTLDRIGKAMGVWTPAADIKAAALMKRQTQALSETMYAASDGFESYAESMAIAGVGAQGFASAEVGVMVPATEAATASMATFGAVSWATVGVWVAIGAAVAGAAYLIYEHFDDITAVASNFFKIFDRHGPKLAGFLGSLQGAFRFVAAVTEKVAGALWAIFPFGRILEGIFGTKGPLDTGVKMLGLIGDAVMFIVTGPFKLIAWVVDNMVENWKTQFNEFVKQANSIMDTNVPLLGNVGKWLGVEHIEPMAAGGIVSGPTPILAGEAGDEVIAPLDEFYAQIRNLFREALGGPALAAAGAEGPMVVTPAGGGTPMVVSQKEVVKAIETLRETLVFLAGRKTPPSFGGGFGSSDKAFFGR